MRAKGRGGAAALQDLPGRALGGSLSRWLVHCSPQRAIHPANGTFLHSRHHVRVKVQRIPALECPRRSLALRSTVWPQDQRLDNDDAVRRRLYSWVKTAQKSGRHSARKGRREIGSAVHELPSIQLRASFCWSRPNGLISGCRNVAARGGNVFRKALSVKTAIRPIFR